MLSGRCGRGGGGIGARLIKRRIAPPSPVKWKTREREKAARLTLLERALASLAQATDAPRLPLPSLPSSPEDAPKVFG